MLRFASMMEPGAGFVEPFLFLKDTLKVLEKAKDPVALCAVFVVKFLLMGGYGIPHESCSRCGAGIAGQPAFYSGGFALYCARCGQATGGQMISPGTLAFVRQVETLEPAKMGRLIISTGTKEELYALLGGFASSAAGKRLEYLEIFKPSVRKALT
jgi:DNA repair protein RecO